MLFKVHMAQVIPHKTWLVIPTKKIDDIATFSIPNGFGVNQIINNKEVGITTLYMAHFKLVVQLMLLE